MTLVCVHNLSLEEVLDSNVPIVSMLDDASMAAALEYQTSS